MSTINYTYNVIVDRFRQFADGHFQLRRFTHGEISQADLEKEAEWPWMHVKPRAINYAPGTRAFSFEVFISDLPRDKEDKTSYQAESITDCSLIFQDLINEIHLGQMFGDDVVLTRPVNSEPFVEQYTHTLTGVTGIIELNLDYDWSACSIPASWNYNTPTNSPSDGWGALQFIESLHQDGVFVSLDNDVEAPGNSYYYGTDGSGVKGWYAIVDNIGLTCETLPDCAVIIGIVDDIIALQTDVALKANSADLGATAFSNDYGDLDNLPTLTSGTVTSVAALTLGTTGTDLSSTVATGTTTPVITLNVPTASAVNRGALSSADWSAFNGKFTLPALTSGSVLFSNGTTIAQDNANFFWDDTNNRLGIGTASPSTSLDVNGIIRTPQLSFGGFDSGKNLLLTYSSGPNFRIFTTAGQYAIFGCGGLSVGLTSAAISPPTSGATIQGNVLIGTTTDAGYKLDVNGTTRTSRVDSLTNQSFTIQYQGSGNQTGNLGDNTAQIRLINNLATTSTTGTNHFLSILPSFTPTSGTTIWNAALINPTINQTGGANGITRGLYINPTLTAAANFRAIETTAGRIVISDTATVTGTNATSLLDLSQTWNTTGTPIALKVNITDTASAALSDLISLQVGGSARFRVLKSGYFVHNTGGEIGGALVVGSSTISASSQLEVTSTTRGFLPPRMTTTQKNAIASPASGLVVYDTTLNKLCGRGASAWETITSI